MIWLHILILVLVAAFVALVVFLLMNARLKMQKSLLAGIEDKLIEEKKTGERLLQECRNNYESRMENLNTANERQIAEVKDGYQRQLDELRSGNTRQLEEMKSGYEKQIAELKDGYTKSLDELKAGNAESIKQLKETQEKELKSAVDNMKAETERILKSREETLTKGNKDNMEGILQPLKESMEQMKKAMQDNQETHIRNTSELGQKLEQAVRDMSERTREVGLKADNLSQALTGRAKVQGCWGEEILGTMLENEGFRLGVHYDREVVNVEGRRPDYVFHFMEGGVTKNLIVDSKVSLTAYTKYMSENITEEEKALALKEHIDSIYKHIGELTRKDYAGADKNSFAKYVLMFLPIDNALRVAMDEDQMLWRNAYNKGVIIVTEQTIMPFLKILSITWTKFRQDNNIEAITKAAGTMIDRVAAFCESYTDLGKKMNAVIKAYNSGVTKLAPTGASIITSAKQVESLGIKSQKNRVLEAPQEEIPAIDVVQ